MIYLTFMMSKLKKDQKEALQTVWDKIEQQREKDERRKAENEAKIEKEVVKIEAEERRIEG